MPAKPSAPKIKPSAKTENPKPKLTWTQVAFGIFAVILILSMVLSSVATNF